MFPFVTPIDLLLAAGVVTGLLGISGGVYLLARFEHHGTSLDASARPVPANHSD